MIRTSQIEMKMKNENRACLRKPKNSWHLETSSVAAGFGRLGSPPASKYTGTTLGQDSSDWSRDLATLTFDLGDHGACGWCGSSSSISTPSLKFIDLAIWKIWRTMCVTIIGAGMTLILDLLNLTLKLVCESHQRWGTVTPNLGLLGLRVLQLFAMYATDGRTDGQTDKSNA